jgi:hypothetical protein
MLTIWCARWLMVAAFAMVEYSTLERARQKREPAHQSLLSRLQRYASSVSGGLAVEMLVHSAGDAVRCICDGGINAAALADVATSDLWFHGERLWQTDNRRAVVFTRPLGGVPRAGYVEISVPERPRSRPSS